MIWMYSERRRVCAHTAAGVASWISAVVTTPTFMPRARLSSSAMVSTRGWLLGSGSLPPYTPMALTDDLWPYM